MQLSNLKLYQLKYFLDAVSSETLSQAARMNKLSRKDFCKEIHELEMALGVPLFVYHDRMPVLTKYGEEFAACAQNVFDELEAGYRKMQQLIVPEDDVVRIGFSFFASVERVPHLIGEASVKAQQDGERVNFQTMFVKGDDKAPSVEDLLLEGTCDLGLTCIRHLEDIASVPVGTQELVLLVPKGHALARRPAVTLAEVCRENFSLLAGDPEIPTAYYMEMFKRVGITPNMIDDGQDWLSLVQSVASGNCLAIVPKLVLSDERVTSVPLDHPMNTRKVYLAWPINRRLSPAAKYVKDLILN